MPRLIDADALIPKGTKVTDDIVTLELALRKAPTIEAEPVVHCRDCEHCLINLKWNTALCMRTVCRQSVPLDGFCNYGERRADDEDLRAQ
jgi:hypothetical protein